MKLDLLTNATVVDDAMKFIEQSKEKLSEGFRNLPQVCLKLSRIVELTYNIFFKTMTIVYKRDNLPDKIVSVAAGASAIQRH